MSHQQAAVNRTRARRLRSVASSIEQTPAMSLERHAGVDTWFGPRPDACCQALTAAQRTLRSAASDLRTTARAFDRHADELDAAAAIAAAVV